MLHERGDNSRGDVCDAAFMLFLLAAILARNNE